MTDGRWLIVGLGNPGPQYLANRHNIGHLVLDVLAERAGAAFKVHKAHAEVAETRLGGPGGIPAVLARPRSFMNCSGGPVAGLTRYYDVDLDHLVVIHDELDLPFGALRCKFGGGDNGHNGLKSLRRSLGGGDFFRVRFGIGRPPGRMPASDFVLRDFSAAERKELDLEIDRAADAAQMLAAEGLEKAQNTFNS